MEKVKGHDACTEVDENEPARTASSAEEVWAPVTSAVMRSLRVSSHQVALLIVMPFIHHHISKSTVLAMTELEVYL